MQFVPRKGGRGVMCTNPEHRPVGIEREKLRPEMFRSELISNGTGPHELVRDVRQASFGKGTQSNPKCKR